MKQADTDNDARSYNCFLSSFSGNQGISSPKTKLEMAGKFLLTAMIILAVLATILLAGLSWCLWRSHQSQEQIYSDALLQVGADLQRQTINELDRNRRQAFLRVALAFLVLPVSLAAWFATFLMVKSHVIKHKRFEADLQNKMQANRLLLDSMPCVALIIRCYSQAIVASNKPAVGFGAVPGRKCFAAWIKRDSPCPWCLAEQAWSTGVPQRREFEALGLNWEAHWVPIAGDLYLHYAFDISERKRLETENEQLNKSLEAENKELQNMMDMASHDLRSPLVNIQGFGTILAETCQQLRNRLESQALSQTVKQQLEPLLEEKIPQSLGFISASAEKMQTLLNSLLQVSRIGTATIDVEPLDMNKMIRKILDSMEFQIERCGTSVTAEPLPGCMGDAGQINQVFSNLIDNAVKYLDPARKGAIRISGRIEKNKAIYCVEDNGLGIADEDKDRVFEIFSSLQPEGPVAGEGLGLTIINRILDRHNGRIWLESKPGKGSAFYVALPVAG